MDFLRRQWAWLALAVPVLAVLSFAIFQPVKVVPRLAYAPEFRLVHSSGQPYTDRHLLGYYKLVGFGYTSDPTGALDTTLADMQAYLDAVAAADQTFAVTPVLILFDARRDTPERLQAFAAERDLDPRLWVLLGGDEESLKRTIGQGFEVYYEAVPLAELMEGGAGPLADPTAYGFRYDPIYILIDPQNIIRAEYRSPIDLELAARDLRLLIREQKARGAGKAINEAAHLFMCYPR